LSEGNHQMLKEKIADLLRQRIRSEL
jgi:hypothetical protein